MRFILTSLLVLFFLNTYSQDSCSIKIARIDSTLQVYGEQQVIANRITLVSIICVFGGTLIGIPAIPLLLTSSCCDLATLLISSKANKKLAKKNK